MSPLTGKTWVAHKNDITNRSNDTNISWQTFVKYWLDFESVHYFNSGLLNSLNTSLNNNIIAWSFNQNIEIKNGFVLKYRNRSFSAVDDVVVAESK